jgi:hypothetical protein
MSTEKTRAPSFARRAANGRPTTSDLERPSVRWVQVELVNKGHLLMTVTVFPYARSPYFKILLYTPTYSKHFTIANGVQGRIDLTAPGGVFSSSTVLDVWKDDRVKGSMKRML